MDFKVIWTEPAIDNLRKIVSHIAFDNPAAAKSVGYNICDHVGVLESFPSIAPLYAHSKDGDIREILFGQYRIFYRIHKTDPVVDILHVRHGAMDEPSLDDLTKRWN